MAYLRLRRIVAALGSLLGCLVLGMGLLWLGIAQSRANPMGWIHPEVDRVMVVANRNSPTSLRVAQYYMHRRRIPRDHLLTLDLPDSTLLPVFESISHATYQQKVEVPLRQFLARRHWQDQIRYIVLTKGVPLRIKEVPYREVEGQFLRQNQSLDSTIAALDYKIPPIEFRDTEYRQLTGKTIFGLLTPNLYWRQNYSFEHRLTGGYLVTRLDGYREEDALALVDRALQSRPALNGTVLLDPNGHNQSTGESNVIDIFDPQSCGFDRPTQCQLQPKGSWESFDKDYNNDLQLAKIQIQQQFPQLQVTMAPQQSFITGENLLGYASWGTNDESFDRQNYQSLKFRSGAIADTLVSSSGRTFFPTRTGQSLIGDLLRDSQGLTGARGYVDEPERQGIGSPTVLFQAYFSGANLATAFYRSIRFIGWRDIVLGDPLATVVFDPQTQPQATSINLPAHAYKES
ncbi:TIGR03790 family protein [Alkalinema sp. FACHB-956]|uniref:TIGR03790 family protein n=1 Tax=Alkalinema sp. FACHB-956 TaxID=2692768 RepID=UPI0016882623|nr:TIGR03790 family protein [Alkalinema sp. FACHB-956]MBD2329081.1 TIGR03790 family protein [Alkalinema sp. FACHB-956]